MNIMKKLFVGLVIVIGLYVITRWGYGEISYAYFQHKCEKDAGEFIYRTVENVEGLYQMRPRDPRDYFDRLRYGDIPEDPYGHTNLDGQNPQSMFLSVPRYRIPKKQVYQYLETTKAPNMLDGRFPKTKLANEPVITGDKYWRYSYFGHDKEKGDFYIAEQVNELNSKYGFTWNEVRDEWDRFFGIWGGELMAIKLDTEEVLGMKRGYFYQNYFSKRMTVCPTGKDSYITYDFISKVLKPIEVIYNGDIQ